MRSALRGGAGLHRIVLSATATALLGAIPANSYPAPVDCTDTETALAFWRPIREQFADAELPVDELAPQLVPCLGSPDPELRDQIAYELFASWLRGERLADTTRRELLRDLTPPLRDPQADSALRRSFSALILAELMRSDANNAFMTTADRADLLATAAVALQREDDFRGLEPGIGWVHPVAHLADLLWRFALHPATTPADAEVILGAVRIKVAPTATFYTFNEGDRLARVVATLIQRNLLDAGKQNAWLGTFNAPRSMERWSDAFRSPQGMAELHNTKQFLRALSDQLEGVELEPEVAQTLDTLVQGFTGLI